MSVIRNASRNAKIRTKLLDLQGGCCALCGSPIGDDGSLDHILPKSRGGTNRQTNLRVVHRSCNVRRGNRFGRADLAALREREMRA
jgi:5-methylcytosine-specific restriction endonuclease McrA